MTTFVIGVALGLFTGTCLGVLVGAVLADTKRPVPQVPADRRASHVRLVPGPRQQDAAS